MPYYEYECEHGEKFTIRASMTAKKPAGFVKDCAEQKGCTFYRILSPFSGKFGDTPRHHR